MPSTTDPKTVLLSGDPIQYEEAAGASITPGEFLVYNSGDVEPGAATEARIAREEGYAGGAIGDDYAIGETVPFYVGGSGDRFYAFLANSQDVSKGDALEANSSGVLEAQSAGTTIAIAAEDLNNTSGDVARIKVEVV